MLKNVVLGKEIHIKMKNEIGVLADVSRILADHGINIEAVAGYADETGNAKIMVATSDNLRALDSLTKERYKDAVEKDVIIADLENKPGALKVITAKLAGEGIDINYTYGTICPTGCPARIVIATNNNEKALVALKK